MPQNVMEGGSLYYITQQPVERLQHNIDRIKLKALKQSDVEKEETFNYVFK